MPPSEPLRVFISYARKDGATLAQRLQKDLKEEGFAAWLDTKQIEGGATWTTKIESALDHAEYVLALMTEGSYVSEICRAEQLRALRKDKCVIPLKAQSGTDIPLHLETKNYRDFTTESGYASSFKLLLEDLHARNGIELRAEFRETYVTAPPLPFNFVERPDELAALRGALISDDGGRHIALTALQGMGGIGKTVLAQALCYDEVVQHAFPDGVVWITVGKESEFDAVTRMREVGKALGDDESRYDNELAAKNQYRTTMRKKAALIVVDDVWRATDIEPLRADSPRSRLLFTTRDASIAAAVGARKHIANLLSPQQSREVFARWAGMDVTTLPAIAGDLIGECAGLPLALSMVGAMVCDQPPSLWRAVLNDLRNADLEKIRAQFPDYPYTDVLRAIQVSVESLGPTTRERYLALAVLLEEMAAAPQVQRCIWGVDDNEAAQTAALLVNRSLAQRDGAGESIRLHDLQLDFVRAQYPDKDALELIHGAVRLSSHIVGSDASQFASQMVGRLLRFQNIPAIRAFISRLLDGAQAPWLRSLHPVLNPPGTALVRILRGHTDWVRSVALSEDGRIAVSASDDTTLKVWNVDTGLELRTLKHNGAVLGVALSGEGRTAISASKDKTLKVWDVGSGQELRTLTGHSGPIRGVALSGDGRIAVSASDDKTLKVWDVASGRELRSFSGHTGSVYGVALGGDGRIAVSASEDQTLKLWDVACGRELRTLIGHSGPVRGVALSGDGRIAVSASDDKTLKIWEVESGRDLRTLRGHEWSVLGVAMSADEPIAVSASLDNTLKLWDVASGRELHTLAGHSSAVYGVALSKDARITVSVSGDRRLNVWEVDSAREMRTLSGHTDVVLGVALSGDSRIAVSASMDNTLKLWDVASARELCTFNGHKDWVRGVALSRDGRIAVSASQDTKLKLWDVASGRELRTFAGHSGAIYGVALSGDGQIAVSASEDTTLKIWEVGNERERRTLAGHSGAVCGVTLSEDNRIAVSASEDTTLKVWEVGSGRELRTLSGHSSAVYGVALSGDGQIAVSASGDRTLKVWEMGSGRELRTLSGHRDSVPGVALTTDGRIVLSASGDSTLKVWGVKEGVCLATFTCDGAAFCCACFDPLKLIVAGDLGGNVHFLRLEKP